MFVVFFQSDPKQGKFFHSPGAGEYGCMWFFDIACHSFYLMTDLAAGNCFSVSNCRDLILKYRRSFLRCRWALKWVSPPTDISSCDHQDGPVDILQDGTNISSTQDTPNLAS